MSQKPHPGAALSSAALSSRAVEPAIARRTPSDKLTFRVRARNAIAALIRRGP